MAAAVERLAGQAFQPSGGRALPAVTLGVVVRIGQMGRQRVPLLKALVRADAADPSEVKLTRRLLKAVGQHLTAEEIALFDAGFKLRDLQAADIKQAVIRLAANVTAYRNDPAPYQGRGRRPVYGEMVRPLARTYKGRRIAATQPDFRTQFEHQGRTIVVKGWHDLILPGVVPDPDNATFDIYVFDDPLYETPLILAATLRLAPSLSFAWYQDRWPVEPVPLSAKQMIGAHRPFVFARESCQRLPELALIAGAILTDLAAAWPPISTGFWDRQPKATPGRLRRVLAQAVFPKACPFSPQLRKKRSQTDHLPKGIAAHRRAKASG